MNMKTVALGFTSGILAVTNLLAVPDPASAQTRQLQVEKSPTRITQTTRAIDTFDGKLVNWAFVNKLTDEPVTSFSVVGEEEKFLLVTVLKRSGMTSYVVSEDEAGPRQANLGGYKLVLRAVSSISYDFSGEDWPFFGEEDAWGQVETKVFMPDRMPRERVVSTFRYSLPASRSATRRYDLTMTGHSGDNQSSGGALSPNSEGSSGNEGCVAFARTFGGYYGAQHAELPNAMLEFTLEELAAPALVGVGALVGGLVTENPVGGAAAGAIAGKITEGSIPYITDALQIALGEATYLSAYIGAGLACPEPGETFIFHPKYISENPRLDVETPPPGAMLVLVCTRWSEEWEEFRQTDLNEYELILHKSKCVTMEPSWKITF